MNVTSTCKLPILSALALVIIPMGKLHATDLSLGADYNLRSINVTERDKGISGQSYYDQQIQAYLTTDLSKDVEASIRVQSITPWGLEGSTSPALATRYPNANGSPWIQNAYVRMPNIWSKKIALTIGRQPIQWGDGTILSDDGLGFDAIRAQLKSPFRFVDFDLDMFTAKITEGLSNGGDTDLNGIQLGFQHEYVRWEIMGLYEIARSQQPYEMGSDTVPVTANRLDRTIYGIRAHTTLKDAFVRGEAYMQSGKVKRGPSAQDLTLGGMGYNVGIGAKSDVRVLGRFGALLELQSGDGDNPSTPDKDEAFRPDFGSKWSGLERKGMGRYFSAGFNDVYSSSSPFAPVSSTNSGLPAGTSGIQTIHFGMDTTPWAEWTFSVDYYEYKAQKTLVSPKDLGKEYDYAVQYRYTGLVTFQAWLADFRPGSAFDQTTAQNARQVGAEASLKF